MRIELTTSSLPRKCSTPELQQLERSQTYLFQKTLLCGQSRVRTYVLVREQIYSLSPLTTRPSALLNSGISFIIQTFNHLNQKFLNFRASGGIRTPDQLITNQLLWPTELHWQFALHTALKWTSQMYIRIKVFFWEGKGNGKCLMEKFWKEYLLAAFPLISIDKSAIGSCKI